MSMADQATSLSTLDMHSDHIDMTVKKEFDKISFF